MGFNIKDFMNEESAKDINSGWKPIQISVHKLRPAAGKENFYHMDDREVEETARTIELVGVQQYPVVKPIKGTDEYEIIAGHKRRLAILKLLAEGKTEYEMIPCKVESAEDGIRNQLILIFTNSTQRERTDYEKMQEIKEVRKLLTEWQKDNKLPGKKQNIIAEILGMNKTKIGTLEHINKKLIEPFKAEYAAGNINTAVANEIAGLDETPQQALYEAYKETGILTAKEVKAAGETAQESYAELQEQKGEYTEPQPESITSICFSCTQYEMCHEKKSTVTRCNAYKNREKSYKTKEQQYDEEQDEINREVKGKLKELAQEEKMNHLPSDKKFEQKEHGISISEKRYEEIINRRLTFLLLKKDRYKVGEKIDLSEYKDGNKTGRVAEVQITYIWQDWTGLKDDYCIIGFAVSRLNNGIFQN